MPGGGSKLDKTAPGPKTHEVESRAFWSLLLCMASCLLIPHLMKGMARQLLAYLFGKRGFWRCKVPRGLEDDSVQQKYLVLYIVALQCQE